MIRAWRIYRAAYAATAFDGIGAATFGGRWNLPDIRAVYFSASEALAMLEVLVHIKAWSINADFEIRDVTFREADIETLDESALPKQWRHYPSSIDTQRIGSAWLRSRRSLVLRVPSVISLTDSNYVVNPEHEGFGGLVLGKARPLTFDSRLL